MYETDGMKRDSAVTIARILDAAEQEFSTHGLLAGRVDEIARLSGCSKQLVYRYFESKHGLYQAVLDNISRRHEAHLIRQDYDGLPPVDALSLFVSRLFDIQKRNGGHIILDLAHQQENDEHPIHYKQWPQLVGKIVACLQKIIERGREAGDFSDDIETDDLLILTNVMTNGSISFGRFIAKMMSKDMTQDQADHYMEELCLRFIFKAMRKAPIAVEA